MSKISVIVSVYNTELYVERCILSILNQSYKDIELVLVDDGSTDNSKAILKRYEGDKRVRLIFNKSNRGLAYSRNIGLEKCSGDYVGFIDSDDYIDEDFYENLMAGIVKNKASIAVCDMKLYYEDSKTFSIVCGCNGSPSKLNFVNNGLAASCCNKLFLKSLLLEYPFEVGKVNEDIAVVIPCLVKASSVCYVPDTYYYYVQRSGSIQNSDFSYKRFDIFKGVESTLKRISGCDDYDDLKDCIVYNQLITLFIYVFPKIKSFSYRLKVLKEYGRLGDKYHFTLNHFYWQFLMHESRKNQLYFRTVFFLERKHLYFLCNFVMQLAYVYQHLFRNSVIVPVTMDKLVKKARYQSRLKASDVSISVIVPNYNYEHYLLERFDSILSQRVKIKEIIILDDVSSDNSRDVIDSLESSLSAYIPIIKIYNEKNSGSPFKQWKKGFKVASGDYVWICEADDYCDKRLLSSLLYLVNKDRDVVLAYSDTAFINATGKVILKSIKPEIDILKSNHWASSYINSGKKEFLDYAYLNNTIANVSSCLIKNGSYDDIFDLAGKYRQAGDWLIYANVMQLGDIAYYDKPLNYYRIHGNNVSSTTKKDKHLKELYRIYDYFDKHYSLGKRAHKHILERIDFLKEAWNLKK